MGGRVESPGAAIHDTSLQVGPAFGDAFAPSLASREIAAFDALGAPFWYDVGNFVTAAARPSLFERFRDFQQLSIQGAQGPPASSIRIPILQSQGESDGAVSALYLAKSGTPAASEGQSLRVCRTQPGRNLPGCCQPERHCAHHGRPCRAGACVRCGAGVACARGPARSTCRLAWRAANLARERVRRRFWRPCGECDVRGN